MFRSYTELFYGLTDLLLVLGGLELNRVLAGACRAPRLKNLGARPKISVPGYKSVLKFSRFGRCLPITEPQKSRCPVQNQNFEFHAISSYF